MESGHMKVAVHVFDGISLFHTSAPVTVFGEVARLGLADDWEVELWSDTPGTIRTAEGIEFSPIAGPSAVQHADILILPSWHEDLRASPTALTDLIRTAHGRSTSVVGLCLGAFPLAEAGTLEGRSAVTHWAASSTFAHRFPGVDVDQSALYIDHGDVLTSAGTASALDACLHIVREQLGASAAARVARQLVIAPHREGGQAQYVERPLPADDGHGALGEVIEWALAHLDRPLSVDDLAEQAHMSRRNFTRRFQEVTGTSPAAWVRSRRLDQARSLLETTSWPISRIAADCGFSSPVTFRQRFVAAYATTPTSYRTRFAQT
ncbi:GlxA family transcriptional regulator [Brevibacterium yomogidense]|uniref:Transcriptional regulator containing an amidase domain and an AraC-type DNA-binding HTH domain n=1 Tax=Brevibacterium yomogidense TaxID=946573 RepID=A0A1X6WVU2_9MICO|nr:helix-turn-helix domain-containing protein [Brevibacterium yomogidense]SLM89556.1 Transcriptional regulator containing an amidase domain and an AraC-type DNA-binding HTH domain [Brevibacterium yomogidense]